MKFLMTIRTTTDATSGGSEDIAAWAEFDKEVRDADVLVEGAALEPPDKSLLVDGPLSTAGNSEVRHGTAAQATEPVQAFYLLNCADEESALMWARKLPTWGTVEIRALLEYDLGR